MALEFASFLLKRVLGVANEILVWKDGDVVVIGIELLQASIAVRMVALHAKVALWAQAAFIRTHFEGLVALVVSADYLIDAR